MPEIKGQALFTKDTGRVLARRLADGNFQSPTLDEVSVEKSILSTFYDDVHTNSLPDTGRWVGPKNTGLFPVVGQDGLGEPQWDRANAYANSFNTANPGNPIPVPYPNVDFITERIHIAAKWAYALNILDEDFTLSGQTKNSKLFANEIALAVFKEILAMANDDDLDASNGGAQRLGGEPVRINTTYGATERFNYTVTNTPQTGSPFMVMSAKITKCIHSLGLIYDIIKLETAYVNDHNTIDYWFLDWVRWAEFQMEIRFSDFATPNWRNFSNDWAGTNNGFQDSDIFSKQGSHAYYTGPAGEGATYRCTRAQQYIFNNRELENVELMDTYGVLYDNTYYQGWCKDYLKGFLALAVYPDGTNYEGHRNKEVYIAENFPDNYQQLSMYIWTSIAHTNYVAAQNRLIEGNGLFYYDFSTSLGSGDLYNTVWTSPTEGGNKSLINCFVYLAKTHKAVSEGGSRGTKYNETGEILDPSDTHIENLNIADTRRLGYALFNKVAQHPELEALVKRKAGYIPYEEPPLTETQSAWHMYRLWGETGILNNAHYTKKIITRRR